tara:strand:+ start:229 stop:375 length:147 start_codon:yes stop_codon:yes gene_type:complete
MRKEILVPHYIHMVHKGLIYTFYGDELTSPEQQAIIKLKELDKDALDE